MDKSLLLLITISLILLSITIVYFATIEDPNTGDPHESANKPLPLIELHLDPDTPQVNITKGTTFKSNLTINSKTDKTLAIPLGFTVYIIRNSTGDEINPEENGFVYSFDPDLIVLDPYGSHSSLITVVISDDVEVGEYQFRFETGNWEETNVGGASLQVFVTSQE